MILEDKARLIALRFKPHNHIALPAMEEMKNDK